MRNSPWREYRPALATCPSAVPTPRTRTLDAGQSTGLAIPKRARSRARRSRSGAVVASSSGVPGPRRGLLGVGRWPGPPRRRRPSAVDWTGPAGASGAAWRYPAYGRLLGALRAGLLAAEVGRGAAESEGQGERGAGCGGGRLLLPERPGPAAFPPGLPPASREAEVTARAPRPGLQGGRGAANLSSSCDDRRFPAHPGLMAVSASAPVRLLAWGTAAGTVEEYREDKGHRYFCCVLVSKLPPVRPGAEQHSQLLPRPLTHLFRIIKSYAIIYIK